MPASALAGISVTDDRHLLGVMMVCGHRIDGATLYADSPEVDSEVTAGSWVADRPLTGGLATWTLDSPTADWTATRSPKLLTAKTTYDLYGWTKDNSWSSSSASFTLADRDRLTPGTVRYDDVSGNGDECAITVPVAEFKTRACEEGSLVEVPRLGVNDVMIRPFERLRALSRGSCTTTRGSTEAQHSVGEFPRFSSRTARWASRNLRKVKLVSRAEARAWLEAARAVCADADVVRLIRNQRRATSATVRSYCPTGRGRTPVAG